MTNVQTDYARALAAFRRAEECFPTNPDTSLSLAQLYDQGGHYDVAQGKYYRARALNSEQSQRTRRFEPRDLEGLNARIDALKTANASNVKPPPPSFTQPRSAEWWSAHGFGKPGE